MNWKTIFIVGLGILSIVVLYYCYKRYYNEEGFQLEVREISSERFENSSAPLKEYTFDGSIITLREIYTEIVTFLTDYRNFSGYADANSYTYFSNKYKKNLTITDFSYPVGGRYWFPYTGQYGASPNWLTNFSNETTARIDLDIYNYNLNRYISFIKSYSGSNKQKFIFNRSLAKPSLIYRDIDLTIPPIAFNLKDASENTIDTNITKVAAFNQNYQSWFTNFMSYAKINKNIYPLSDYKGDTEYRIFYSGNVNNDKPPDLTYSNINNSKQAGQIVNLIPDRKNDINNINEQLKLNIYGGELTGEQINSFRDCMFLGSVFTNFDDQYNLDTILCVPYNGIVNGSKCYYSFNMFTPEFTYTYVSPKVYEYQPNQSNITYNTNLINLRSGDNIIMLNENDLKVSNSQFRTNVNTTFSSRNLSPIANSYDAYVGIITPQMMAKIPNLARRYITSWVHNRSRKYLTYLSNTITGSVNLNTNELKKAQYISLAIKNFSGEKLNNFLTVYADYGSYTALFGIFIADATITNVPNEDAAKRIVASSRIYNSYQYNPGTKIVTLSKSTTGGNVFNSMNGSIITRNEFRNANPTKSITSDVITTLAILLNNIGRALQTFPTDGIDSAKGIIDSITAAKKSSFIDLFNKAYISVNYVKTILNGTIRTLCGNISESLNKNSINDAMIQIKELVKMTEVTSPSEYTINSISGNGTDVLITINTVRTIGLLDITEPVLIFIGDYISINGTDNYDGRFFKIVETTTNPTNYVLKIKSSKNVTETMTSSKKIQLDSLHKYLKQAQSDTNTLKNSIDGISVSETTISQEEKDIILKDISVNKKFIDSFYTNYDRIKMIINSIYKGNDINQMINKIIVNTSSIAQWNNTLSYNINDYVRINTQIYQSIKVNKGISPPNTTYWKEFIILIWNNTILYDINDYVKIGTTVYKSLEINKDKSPLTNSTYWKELTDNNIRTDISGVITTMETAISNITTFLTDLATVKNSAKDGDATYNRLVTTRDTHAVNTESYDQVVNNINTYLNTLPQYMNADSIISYFSTTKESLTSTKTAVEDLKATIGGTGPIADAMAAPTNQEIQALMSDFENLIHNNKLLPDYGYLKDLNINDPSFLNSIAQLYYESSDGLYEMTTIYDVFIIGSNSVDIRFDKKQRLPKGRINNLNILYLPEIQKYNSLLDIMEDGSWSNYYKDVKYTLNGQNLTSNAIDFYYEDLSSATSKLEPIFNPIYPIDETINVKDLQIELKNLNTSNNLITRILTGKLKTTEAPFISETPETVGYNYTDRLLTIQYGIQDKIYKIETQISGILQSCARVFVTPVITSEGKLRFPINGMAIGVNAALTYNLAYNGNLEVDMANTQGNIGQYNPTIVYTKNFTPPIICGDIKFINKAVAIFNQTAFLNLSSFTTKITGDDITKRQQTETIDVYDVNINARINNFYDSNDGPLYVDKILGFQQVNSNTCYYKWQETQYDPLTNGIFTATTGDENLRVKRRVKNVQYQFIYDNLKYQDPRLIPDNNPGGTRPNEGFKYLPDNSNVLFGDLYLSLYSWYASATRDLYSYLNEISNKYNTLYTPQYSDLIRNYNIQTSNISTLNHNTMALFSTNLLIAKDFRTISRNVTVTNTFDDILDKQIAGTCDSIIIKPPIFTNNYDNIIYNYRPGNGEGKTSLNNERQIQASVNSINRDQFRRGEYNEVDEDLYNDEVTRIRQGRQILGTYNKYRTVDIKDFFNNILNKTYKHDISKCDNAQIDPENCFIAENDGCKYTYLDINSNEYKRIVSNIIIRDGIKQAINNTNTLINTTSNNIKTLINQQTRSLLGNNIVQAKGRDYEEIYPEISNINDQITSLINNSNTTNNSISDITEKYYTLLRTQTSDSNLPIYVANQTIPITKPLPEESYSLENHYGQCPAYSCTSPVVMNSLIEQYNLNTEEPLYDDTIVSILKGATPNSYQCDYLVEVRKKNAIITNTNIEFDRIRFIPVKPLYSDNREAIYFPGNNHIQLSSSCMNIDSNNFTIDWFQYIILDDENPDPFVFSYGDIIDRFGTSRNIAVQFITDSNDKSSIKFTLFINDIEFIFINNVNFNYNQLNRWTYFAIVRNNNVITCYKDGFAFISGEISAPIINSSTVYIGNDGKREVGKYFKGAICNFSFNNYDALYTNNFFNTVPSHTTPVKNINTKFIIDIKNNTVDNIISRTISNQNINILASGSQPIIQTYLTNGTLLREIFRGNNQNNAIVIDPSNRIYIADTANHLIKVRENDGKYTTIVGTGRPGMSSSTELLNTPLYSPSGLCFGNTLYIADTGNNRICYIRSDNTLQDLITGATNISHIAYYSPYVYYLVGNTIGRKNVINSPFTNTQNYITISASTLSGISFDNVGNLYIADSQNNYIYRVLSGSTTATIIINTGLNKPLSVTADSSRNLYIANSGDEDSKVYMAVYDTNNDTYSLNHIAGNGSRLESFNEGYAKIIPLTPRRVLYHNNTLYIVDSRRICYIEKANIPNIPNNSIYIYYFNNQSTISSLRVGSNQEADYKFNKNLFTIQWFMYMEDSTQHTIFTFENVANYIYLGVSFNNNTSTTRMNLHINNQATSIEFNKKEIVGLWVHMGIINNGSTLSIYKNSILVYSLDSRSLSFNSSGSQLTIGNRFATSIEAGFKGQLLSFMIYNKVARNYNSIIEAHITQSLRCIPNLVLHLANGTNTITDSSLPTLTIYSNSIMKIDSYPYSTNYNNFTIRLYYSDNTTQDFNYNQGTYGTAQKEYGYTDDNPTDSRSLGATKKRIRAFRIYSQTHEKAVQQWLLEGSENGGIKWISLHKQLTPYISRSSPIYPKANTYSEEFLVVAQANIGGDIVKMTKSFKVATLIEDCSYVITSNINSSGDYTKGVTSSNGFFIQDNTPYVQDTSGTDISGFQYIGNLLGDYESNIESVYDPVISNSSTISGKMFDAYNKSKSDTYGAVGKLNTLNFYSSKFNKYDSLRTYMTTNVRFRNTIFDGYSDSNSYMSNIIRFSIVDSDKIDIVFNKVDLTGLTMANIGTGTTYNFASRITTAGARYSLSVSQGFLDLTATFLSNVMPFSNIFNDDFTTLTNSRNMDYKDRLNQRAKLVPGVIIPSATLTPFTIAITPLETERLTGLTGIIGSNIISSPAINKVEYILDNESGTLPISKTNYIVQYISDNEVNSVIPATLDNTSFKINIPGTSAFTLDNLIATFKTYFNTVYKANTDNGYPYNSVMRKVDKYSIVNKILYVSCSVEYTTLNSSETTIIINYNKTPNIKQFKTEVYYRVIFKSVNKLVISVLTDVPEVIAFEPCLPTAGGSLTVYVDSNNLLIEGATSETDLVIRNNYITNLLFTEITFIPKSLSYTTSYSIAQIEFFKNNTPIRIDSISINGGITDDYDLTMLIDGVNPKLKGLNTIIERIFTHTYDGGEISAKFNKGTNMDGFSFMTGSVENNPQGWTVKGTADGTVWIELMKQDTVYNTAQYSSFYRTPIFSFTSAAATTITEQPNIPRTTTSRSYKFLRIRNAKSSKSSRFQITNITLYDNKNLVTVNTATIDPTDTQRNLTYLFRASNLNSLNSVITYENDNNTTLTIQLTATFINFNGISFVSGIDVDKCMDTWIVEASLDGTSWTEIVKQDFPYVNEKINFPHFFCRTPIFYYYLSTTELSQPALYDIKFWPIRYVRFTPIYMYGETSSTEFEVSHFEFFKDGIRLQSLNSSVNMNLITPYINTNPTPDAPETTINDLTIFRGRYQVNTINFEFNSNQSFNGFSFMSGPDINKCIQLWRLEVSTNGTFWVTVHFTPDNKPYSDENYPSSYYRLPHMTFFKNISIESSTQYYIISGTPTANNNNGSMFKIRLLYSYFFSIPLIKFTTIIDGTIAQGIISIRSAYNIADYAINWSGFFNSPINPNIETLYRKNEDFEAYKTIIGSPTTFYALSDLYQVKQKVDNNLPYYALLDITPPRTSAAVTPDPRIFGSSSLSSPITPFLLYRDTITSSGRVNDNSIGFDTIFVFYLDQLSSWVRPVRRQGFTNYISIDYMNKFLVETSRPLNSDFFRLIGPNKKVIDKKFYTVELDSKIIMINLIANIEIIGYTITTGLYSHLSDANSWKVYGMKKNKWILLDKQDNYDIPVERSYTLPPFYFNSKKIIKDNSAPNIKIIEDYYKKKINPFGKAVFKEYMFDNNKTYYMVFDEYDNNRNLIDTDLIIGFVMGKGVVKKPIMYENPDGSFDAFNLKKKEMMSFWKKKVGLKLETKYLSDY